MFMYSGNGTKYKCLVPFWLDMTCEYVSIK